MDIEVIRGDITAQPDLDAVVNAANARLMPGGGVAGAIHRAAGPDMARACWPLAPIQPGEAVITPGFGLPNPWVIHTLGPVWGRDEPAAELLADCYRNSLRLSEEKKLSSIGFPAISTGAFGYPMEDAASITLDTVRSFEPVELEKVRFVLFGGDALRAFKDIV